MPEEARIICADGKVEDECWGLRRVYSNVSCQTINKHLGQEVVFEPQIH